MVGIKRYVDVNVFIYWLGKHPSLGETAYKWIKDIEGAPPGEYVISALTLYEVLVIIAGLSGKSLRDEKVAEGAVKAVTSLRGLALEDLKAEDYIKALSLMKRYDLDFEDALHTSIALRLGLKEAISNDKDLDRTPLRRIFS